MMTPPSAGEKGITPEPPQSPRRLRAVQAAEAESAMRTPERSLHNLPSELSSFVGREKELAEVKRLLENTRLLTLTGAGGLWQDEVGSGGGKRGGGRLRGLLLEFPHFVMERGMLKGIKRRAESASAAPRASQRFQRETVIERPVEKVFDFVTDARNEPQYNPPVLNVEKRTAGPISRGTRFVLVSKAMGRPLAVEYEITAYERPYRMISRTIRGLPLMNVESTEIFEPANGGTRMRWVWEVKPRGTAGKLTTPVLARMLGRRLDRVFANIKRVLEGDVPAARTT